MKVTKLVEKLRKIYPESMIQIEACFESYKLHGTFHDPVDKYWRLYISDITHTERFKTFDALCKYVTEINI